MGGGGAFITGLCGAWAAGVGRGAGLGQMACGVAVEGRMGHMKLNQGELAEGRGPACSLGLGRERLETPSSQVLRRVGRRRGGTCSSTAHHPMGRKEPERG